MGFAQSGESVCPIAQTLAIVGERWTMLLLRELFMGSTRFDEFQMYTDISPHLLSTRLKGLEAQGIVQRTRYQDRPPRFDYKLTPKGMDLFPLIVSLKAFGDKWGQYGVKGRTAVKMVHAACGHSVALDLKCAHCEETWHARNTSSTLSQAFAAEREERKAAFLARQRSA